MQASLHATNGDHYKKESVRDHDQETTITIKARPISPKNPGCQGIMRAEFLKKAHDRFKGG